MIHHYWWPTAGVYSILTDYLFSFAQWQYRSLWGLSEARLLLIENYTQYPALAAWNMADCAIFVGFYGSQYDMCLLMTSDTLGLKIQCDWVIENWAEGWIFD